MAQLLKSSHLNFQLEWPVPHVSRTMREKEMGACHRTATAVLCLISFGKMQMQISCHANSADPSTIFAPAPFLPPSSQSHAGGQDKRREMGEALETLSQFTLNLSEPIQGTLILLTGFYREHCLVERAYAFCCQGLSDDFFVLHEHSDSGRVNIRSEHFSAMSQTFTSQIHLSGNNQCSAGYMWVYTPLPIPTSQSHLMCIRVCIFHQISLFKTVQILVQHRIYWCGKHHIFSSTLRGTTVNNGN